MPFPYGTAVSEVPYGRTVLYCTVLLRTVAVITVQEWVSTVHLKIRICGPLRDFLNNFLAVRFVLRHHARHRNSSNAYFEHPLRRFEGRLPSFRPSRGKACGKRYNYDGLTTSFFAFFVGVSLYDKKENRQKRADKTFSENWIKNHNFYSSTKF